LDIGLTTFEAAKGWGGWSLFFLALLWWIRGIPDRRRAESDADAALRSDYGIHMERLEGENEKLRDRLAQLEIEYEKHRKECRKETDELHELIRSMKKHMDGLEAAIRQNSQSTAMLLDSKEKKG